MSITSTSGVFGTPLTLATTGGTTSGAVTFPTVIDGTAVGCSVVAGVLTVTDSGTCVVTAQMAGDANYEPVSSEATMITIQAFTPSLGTWNPATTVFAAAPFVLAPPTVTGTGGASLANAGAWNYVSSNPSIATVMGTSIDPGIVGVATITGTFTPDDTVNYVTVTATTTVTITKANQSTLVISNPSTFTYGGSLNLVTTGGSGSGALVFTIDDTGTTAPGCAIAGRTLTSTGTGDCVVSAVKSGDPNHNASNIATQTVQVVKADQTVSFTTSPPLVPRPFGSYSVAASATSGLAASLAIATGSPGVCQLSVGVVTFNAAGTCVITASQAGDGNFNPAVSVSQTIVVGKLNQSITFVQPADKDFDDPAFALTATASSGLPVRFVDDTAQMTTPYACSVDDTGIVTIAAVGPCAITVSQAGNAQYAAASNVTRVFQVSPVSASAPYITSVNVQNAGATLTFTAPGFNGGSTITAYQVNAIPANGGAVVSESGCSASGSPLSCTMTGLVNGTAYRFTVQAITAAGLGAASGMVPAANETAITSAVRANAVSALTAEKGNTQLTARWQALTVAQLGGGTFTRYDLRIAVAADDSTVATATLNTQSDDSYVFAGLDNGTAYQISVVAITSANSSAITGNTAIVTEIPARAPDPVVASFTPTSGTTATVSWPAPVSDGGSPVTAYNVTVTGDGGPFTCTALPPARACQVSGLTRGAAYAVAVEVVNGVGSSTDPATDVRQPDRPAAPVITA
ncbi:MAG: fibronectin type III domain-containing protein, partial [Ilumatobacteraceae bacterium]